MQTKLEYLVQAATAKNVRQHADVLTCEKVCTELLGSIDRAKVKLAEMAKGLGAKGLHSVASGLSPSDCSQR